MLFRMNIQRTVHRIGILLVIKWFHGHGLFDAVHQASINVGYYMLHKTYVVGLKTLYRNISSECLSHQICHRKILSKSVFYIPMNLNCFYVLWVVRLQGVT